MRETSTLTFECKNPNCENIFKAHIVEHKGGVNDYGSWILECNKCGEIFSTYIGRDVNDSRLTSGGTLLGTYDKELYTNDQISDEVKKFRQMKNK